MANRLPDIAKAAGEAILNVYNSPQAMQGHGVQHKADASPLTEADLSAHRVIVQQLAALGTHIPIVSEEDDASHARRVPVGAFWIIDPLDGTKEFIARNGQFTVNIALVRDGVPVFGVVYAPVLDEMFWNVPEEGAWLRRAGVAQRQNAVEQAEVIIENQVTDFMHWLGNRELVPTIRALRDTAERARRNEVERALRKLNTGEDPQRVIEALSQALTAR
jgi:3'(2'), 5'-bisphosphate nucleotidase